MRFLGGGAVWRGSEALGRLVHALARRHRPTARLFIKRMVCWARVTSSTESTSGDPSAVTVRLGRAPTPLATPVGPAPHHLPDHPGVTPRYVQKRERPPSAAFS